MPFTPKYKADLIELFNHELDALDNDSLLSAKDKTICLRKLLANDTAESDLLIAEQFEYLKDFYYDASDYVNETVINNPTLYTKEAGSMNFNLELAHQEYFEFLTLRVYDKINEINNNHTGHIDIKALYNQSLFKKSITPQTDSCLGKCNIL